MKDDILFKKKIQIFGEYFWMTLIDCWEDYFFIFVSSGKEQNVMKRREFFLHKLLCIFYCQKLKSFDRTKSNSSWIVNKAVFIQSNWCFFFNEISFHGFSHALKSLLFILTIFVIRNPHLKDFEIPWTFTMLMTFFYKLHFFLFFLTKRWVFPRLESCQKCSNKSHS